LGAGSLLFALSFLATLPTTTTAQLQHRQPHKRTYDSHIYYVLETREDSPHGPAELARAVGAELVERVGELDGHWLVRAEKEFVTRGSGDRYLAERSMRERGFEPVERDAVMERYAAMKEQGDLVRRSGDMSSYMSRRHPSSSIISLERQILRKRAKRDVVYVVGDNGHPNARAEAEETQESLSSLAAKRFGIADPIWSKQWHLVNDDMKENMVNATGSWADGVTGKGIKVAIVDDGLDMHSDDLGPNFVRMFFIDFTLIKVYQISSSSSRSCSTQKDLGTTTTTHPFPSPASQTTNTVPAALVKSPPRKTTSAASG